MCVCEPLASNTDRCLTAWFTETDIDGFMALDSELMRGETLGPHFDMLSSRCRGLLSLCISDTAKQMLLNSSGFVAHLIDGAYAR